MTVVSLSAFSARRHASAGMSPVARAGVAPVVLPSEEADELSQRQPARSRAAERAWVNCWPRALCGAWSGIHGRMEATHTSVRCPQSSVDAGEGCNTMTTRFTDCSLFLYILQTLARGYNVYHKHAVRQARGCPWSGGLSVETDHASATPCVRLWLPTAAATSSSRSSSRPPSSDPLPLRVVGVRSARSAETDGWQSEWWSDSHPRRRFSSISPRSSDKIKQLWSTLRRTPTLHEPARASRISNGVQDRCRRLADLAFLMASRNGR